MSITLDQDIYKWLLGLDVIKITALSSQLPDGRAELDPSVTSYFSTGLIFSRLISKIVKNLSKTSPMSHINLANLDSIKFTSTQASLTYNWNLIVDVLKQLSIPIDADVKSLIINGDIDMINDLLKEMYKFYHPKGSPTKKVDMSKLNMSSDNSFESSPPPKFMKKAAPSQFKQRNFETDAIDIEKVKANKDLGSTTSVLEFFLVSLSRHLSLTPKQTVTLLTNGFKYLAHIFAKGVKGVFEPITYWYQEVYAHVEHLVTLIEKDKENNIVLVQQACRPGLLSKNAEVVEWSCRFFSKLAYEFTNKNMMQVAWEWFISDHGGMQGCLMGLKRHPQLADSVISVLVQYARYDMIDLFTLHLKNICPDPKEQIQLMMILFKPLSESSSTKEEVVNSGVLDAWIEFVVKLLENDSTIDSDTRQICLGLLCDVWVLHPQKVEEQDFVSAAILNNLKKSARDRSKAVVMSTIGVMFKLLEHFAAEKNNYAAVVYKTLTFATIENYTNTSLREFLLRNFKLLFESNQSIPIGILLDPLLKQMQSDENTKNFINVFDFEFFNSVLKHPKFTEANALTLFYVMADVYLNNLAFSRESQKILFDLLSVHIENEPLQEAISKFVKASLAMFYSSEKNKRPKIKPLPSYNNQMQTVKPVPIAEAESETLRAQKRAMIIQILQSIFGLNNKPLKEKCKPFVIYTHVQLKTQLKTEHKGILALISQFGDTTELIAQFEKELKAKSPEMVGDTSRDLDIIDESTINSRQTDSDALNFLKGVGSSAYNAYKIKKMTKSQVTESALRKIQSSKPDPKVEEELSQIQREYQRKRMKKIEDESVEKDKVDKQKKNLKTQLDKRKIELGVASRNQGNAEENIVFEEGSRALEKLLEKKHGLSEIELVDLENEEERDKEAVQIFLKKYRKILHYLFVSYSNVGFSNQDKSSFDKLADKLAAMNLNELWKLLQDHDCIKFSTKEETQTLVRLINSELLDRHELKNLTFQGFKDFFVQFAILIFSRPPKDLSHMPVFVSVDSLLQMFREATAKRGKSTLLYDNPDSTEVGDKDLHAFLNDALQKDPEYPLPEAYKKVVEKNVEYNYQLPEALTVPESYLICYQALDVILNKALGIRLIEPMVNFSAISKAKLKVFDPTKIDYSPDHHLKAKHTTVNPKKLTKNEAPDAKRRVLPTNENRPKLSLELKKEVADYPYKERAVAQDCAEVLEELLQAVEEGKDISEVREKQVIKNKVVESKEKEKELLLQKQEASEAKRKQRHQEVKVLADEYKTKKEDTKAKQATNESPTKKVNEERVKYLNEQKEKAKEYKDKKEEDKKSKKEDEERKKKQEEEEKKKQFKSFNVQKVGDYQKKFEEAKGKRDEDEKKKVDTKDDEKRKKTARETKMKGIWEKDKETLQKNREISNRIKEMVKESEMKTMFNRYEKQLQFVFKYYVETQHTQLGSGHALQELQFQGYAAFASDFNIFPGIVSLRELRLLYNSMTIGKDYKEETPVGLTYEEFLESLLRVTIKGREKLDKIFDIKKRMKEANTKEKQKTAEEELQKERESEGDEEKHEEEADKEEDTYEEIEGTTKNTLEGLVFYMDLPEDKNELTKKLKFLKESRPKNWREKKNYWKKDMLLDNMQEMMANKLAGLGASMLGGGGDQEE